MKQPNVKASDILALLKDQGGRCALTGDELTIDNVSADHSIPVSRGGDHAIGNIILVTKEVNRAKHTMTPEEFISMCRKVVSYADRASL